VLPTPRGLAETYRGGPDNASLLQGGAGSSNSGGSRIVRLLPRGRRKCRGGERVRRSARRCWDRSACVGVSAARRTERSRPRRLRSAPAASSAGRPTWATLKRIPPTRSDRSLRNSACRPRRSVARLRGASCRPSSAVLVGLFRQTPSASGRPHRRHITRRAAGALLHSLPLPRPQVPPCAQSSAESATRRAAELEEARDERREGSSGRG
jgi:hypothetical protein